MGREEKSEVSDAEERLGIQPKGEAAPRPKRSVLRRRGMGQTSLASVRALRGQAQLESWAFRGRDT